MILPFSDSLPVIQQSRERFDYYDEEQPQEVQRIPHFHSCLIKPRVKSTRRCRAGASSRCRKPLVVIADFEGTAAAEKKFDSSSTSHNSTKRRKTTSALLSTSKNLIYTMEDMLFTSSSVFDILAAMGHQEKTRYNDRVDFLAEAKEQGIDVQIDQECRRKMAKWCYDVCETYHLSPEVVEITMNMLDRFLATPAGKPALENRRTYQLACMTCLYTAVKTHETQVMSPQIVSTMSRGVYSEQQIVQMESNILTALQFRVHPPTPTSFVRSYLDVLTTTRMIPALKMASKQQQQTVMDLSALQVKAAVLSYQFVATPASAIAYCCLVNSLEAIGILDDKKVRPQVEWFLSQFVLHANTTELSEYSRLLYSAISCSDKDNVRELSSPPIVQDPKSITENNAVKKSPKSVIIS